MKKKNYLSIELKPTEKQLALVAQLGSRSTLESLQAAEAIAQVVSEPLLQVINQAPVISNFFEELTYDVGTTPSIPLDTYFNVRARNYFQTWVGSLAGGSATNFVQGADDVFVHTYDRNSAASMNKSWARARRLDVVARTLTRLAQEHLVLRNRDAATILMNALATAIIDGNPANTAATNYQVIRAAIQGRFGMHEFNKMLTKYKRIVSSWVGGTPVDNQAELTDFLGSPEWMEEIRGMAYQPQNTRATPDQTESTVLAAPESVREEVWRSGGIPTIFNKALHQYNELGQFVAATNAGTYNSLFGTFAGATAYQGYGDAGTAPFTATSEQIVVGLNNDMFDLVRMTETGGDRGAFSVAADDTFTMRSKKVGWVSEERVGFASLDNRSKMVLIF